MRLKIIITLLYFVFYLSKTASQQLNIKGSWQFGFDRKYDKEVNIMLL